MRQATHKINQPAVIDCNNLVYRIADIYNKQKGEKLTALKFVYYFVSRTAAFFVLRFSYMMVRSAIGKAWPAQKVVCRYIFLVGIAFSATQHLDAPVWDVCLSCFCGGANVKTVCCSHMSVVENLQVRPPVKY